MKNELLIGLGTAVFAGVLIGIQATLISRGGAACRAVRARFSPPRLTVPRPRKYNEKSAARACSAVGSAHQSH